MGASETRDDEKYITLTRDRTNSLNLLTHVSKT